MPDPVLENDTFLDFEKIYGTNTEEVARPSAQRTPEKSERDKKFKSILVASMSYLEDIHVYRERANFRHFKNIILLSFINR